MSNSTTIRILNELIEALDRRLPQVQRSGEAAIVRDAAALRSSAIERIAELEHQRACVEPACYR